MRLTRVYAATSTTVGGAILLMLGASGRADWLSVTLGLSFAALAAALFVGVNPLRARSGAFRAASLAAALAFAASLALEAYRLLGG